MLTPSERWSWTYCQERDRLLLDINEQLQFCSQLAGRQLTEKPVAKAFSMAEAETFWCLRDGLESLNLSDAQILELCLHALAARYYAQHTGHKSWYFSEQTACNIEEFQLVQLSGAELPITALVLQIEGGSATCLLLNDGLSLSGKQLQRCSILRVLLNRLCPVSNMHYLAQTA